MTVVMADDLVRLEVPALDHLVLAAGEEVWMSWGNGQAAHRRDVAREREAEVPRRQIPNLDGAVAGARSEPFVAGLNGQRAHPT